MSAASEEGKTPTINVNLTVGQNSFLNPNMAVILTLSRGATPSTQELLCLSPSWSYGLWYG